MFSLSARLPLCWMHFWVLLAKLLSEVVPQESVDVLTCWVVGFAGTASAAETRVLVAPT